MLGHASLDMVRHCAQMVDDDLLQTHQAHSPTDNLQRLNKNKNADKLSAFLFLGFVTHFFRCFYWITCGVFLYKAFHYICQFWF